MSNKRGAAESGSNEPTTEGSDLFQQENKATLAKLTPVSDATFQDLPIEVLEYILVKVVAMEVVGTMQPKSAWKETSVLMISRLRSVCSLWSGILATNFFRNAVHRTLDCMAEKRIRMEMLYQSTFQLRVFKVTTLKDEIYMLSKEDINIVVYERKNMIAVKQVIPLPGILKTNVDIASCIVSNCVYVLGLNATRYCHAISRITKDEEHQFSVSPWISDLGLSFSIFMSVSANGNLILLSNQQGPNPAVVGIYTVNGTLQHKMRLSSGICDFRMGGNVGLLQKSNGNLVLVSLNDRRRTQLTEIAMSGTIVRQYQSTLGEDSAVHFADIYGRIVISEPHNGIELLDSELNLLHLTGAPLYVGRVLHYNSEKNEMVGIYSQDYRSSVINVFRFTEDDEVEFQYLV